MEKQHHALQVYKCGFYVFARTEVVCAEIDNKVFRRGLAQIHVVISALPLLRDRAADTAVYSVLARKVGIEVRPKIIAQVKERIADKQRGLARSAFCVPIV